MKRFIFLLLMLLILFSCTKDDDPISSNDPPTDETITEQNIYDFRNANLTFSHKIFKEIVSQSTTDENIMISPVSISIAFSMLNNGAANNSKDQIKQVLEYEDVPDHCINTMFKKLAEKLDSLNSIIDIDLVNSNWFDDGFPVYQNYIEKNETYYDAEIRNIDLDITASIDTINAWIYDKTDGKIEDVLSHDDAGAEFFLVNAINFLGFWKFPFDADETQGRRFYSEDGTYETVTTMYDNGINEDAPCRKFDYLVSDSFKAVKMPYGNPDETKNSEDVSMYVFVPDSTLENFTGNELNTANWNEWMDSFVPFEEQYGTGVTGFNFSLPKFKYETDINLVPIMEALGITDIFGPAADLSLMTEYWQGLFIGIAKQQSFIDVNEEGTSAAAVTIIGGYNGIDDSFEVNKPFLFAIRDDLSGTILFMGQVYDPEY